jgi:hypothetical protein
MTIITDFKEMLRLEHARRQPALPFGSFSVNGMLTGIRAELFPEVTQPVLIRFVTEGPLACICSDKSHATIYIHQLLNHHETPVEVISTIIKHELLHLRILPAILNGREVQHPEEFWNAEMAIAPERKLAWLWIYTNFPFHVQRRPRLERVDVARGWRQVWSRRRNSIEECKALVTSGLTQPDDIW